MFFSEGERSDFTHKHTRSQAHVCVFVCVCVYFCVCMYVQVFHELWKFL